MKMFFITSSMPLSPMPYVDQLGKGDFNYGLQIQADNVSDGFHTMHELYQHRMALNIALFHAWHQYDDWEVMKAKQHADGTMFEGYFIVMAVTPYGQISYHYKLEHWDKFRIPEVEKTPEWDKHNSLQVMERLMQL